LVPRCISGASSLTYNSCSIAKIEIAIMITAYISRFVDDNVDTTGQGCIYVECLDQFGWVQRFGIFDSNLAVNYSTIGCMLIPGTVLKLQYCLK